MKNFVFGTRNEEEAVIDVSQIDKITRGGDKRHYTYILHSKNPDIDGFKLGREDFESIRHEMLPAQPGLIAGVLTWEGTIRNPGRHYERPTHPQSGEHFQDIESWQVRFTHDFEPALVLGWRIQSGVYVPILNTGHVPGFGRYSEVDEDGVYQNWNVHSVFVADPQAHGIQCYRGSAYAKVNFLTVKTKVHDWSAMSQYCDSREHDWEEGFIRKATELIEEHKGMKNNAA